MGLFDLEKHFAFYGAYHSNPTNIVIHMIFVWPILFTALVLLYFTPPLFKYSPIELGDQSVLILNYGFFFTVIYALYYVGLDKKAGFLAAFLCFVCWVGSSFLAHRLGYTLAWKKRAPALLDNLAQAFLMGPFFVLLEGLQSAFGYEPYPGFHARVKAKVDAEIKEWKDKKQNKLS
ncbi:hypothetical protein ACJIZ3_005327 [Penstemon smallii]|uniref:Uncharacterized protein n=1 Tax=Penstemon smallii TaxID=265156 RepID=A0ABD3S4P9_9LAMI